MTHPLQLLSDTMTWSGKNIAYNLNSIPDDKLSWKPAPEAKNTLEIAAEIVETIGLVSAVLKERTPDEKPTFSTREEAQKAVETASADYGQLLLSLGENELTEDTTLPFGTLPTSRAIALPVVDALHHHGQIAYLQTLLGDTTTHFWDLGN